MKIVAFIPAHLASLRFPRKVLFDFRGLPMIEHVRRRACLASSIDEVYVATCDEEIRDVIEKNDGKVIMTSNTHTNGTSRIAEAVKNIECSHVIVLQADEPLLLPEYLNNFVEALKNSVNSTVAWNATGPIEDSIELDRHSFVKCFVNQNDRIITCFRRSPCYSEVDIQKKFIRKILGIIAYKKEFLEVLLQAKVTPFEKAESIEQMRIIELEYPLFSVPMKESLPSVNEPLEADEVIKYLETNSRQREILNQIL